MSASGDPFDSLDWDSQATTPSTLDNPPEGNVALGSDGSMPSIRSPSLVLQALLPLIISIWLLLAGRRLYRFTTSVSVALSTVFFGWALLVNLESGSSLGGLTAEVAASTVWSTMVGLGLIGAVLGFQATWWGAHITGRLCLGANAGLAFAFSILFLRANFSIHAPAGQGVFVCFFAILGIVTAFYDHVTGPLIAIALEGSFLFMLAVDLFVTLGNSGAAAGFKALIDHNPAHAILIVPYNPPKSTRITIGFSWIIGLASFCFQYKYYSMQFGPLPRLRASDEEKGLKRATLELAAKRMHDEQSDMRKFGAESAGDEPETLVITNNHHLHSDTNSLVTETLAITADFDQNASKSPAALADQATSIPVRPSRVLLNPPAAYASPAALALSPTVYSRYRRTPGPSPKLPSRAAASYQPRSNLVRYKQMRRVETVDEVTEASTSVNGGNETDQDQVSLLTIGDGAERFSTRTDVMSEEYLHAVLRLAAGEGGEGRTNQSEQAQAVNSETELEEMKAPPEASKLRRTDSTGTGSTQSSLTQEQLATSPILAKPTMDDTHPEDFHDALPTPMFSMIDDPEGTLGASVGRSEAENSPEFGLNNPLEPQARRSSCSSLNVGIFSDFSDRGNPSEEAKDEERSLEGLVNSRQIGAADVGISRSAPGSVFSRASWELPLGNSRCLGGMRGSAMYSARSQVTSIVSADSEDATRTAPTGGDETCEAEAAESVRPTSQPLLPLAPLDPDADSDHLRPAEDHRAGFSSPNPQKGSARSLKSSASTRSSVLDSFLRRHPDSSVPTTPSTNGSATVEVTEEVMAHYDHSKESLVDLPTKQEPSEDDSSPPFFLKGEQEKESVSSWSSGKMTAIPHTPTMGNMLLRVSGSAERVRREASGSETRHGANHEGGSAEVTKDHEVDEADQDTVRRTESSRSTICMGSAYRCSSAEDGDGPSSGSEAADESDHGPYFQPQRFQKLDQILDEWGKLLGDDRVEEGQAEVPRDGPSHRSPSLQSIALPSRPSILTDRLKPSHETIKIKRPGAACFLGEPLEEDSWPRKRASLAERGPYPPSTAQRWSSVSSVFPTFGRESSSNRLDLRRSLLSGEMPSRVDRDSFRSEPRTASGLGHVSEKESSSVESVKARFCSGSFYLGYKHQSSEKGSEENTDEEGLCLEQMDHSAERKSQNTTIMTGEGGSVTADDENNALHLFC